MKKPKYIKSKPTTETVHEYSNMSKNSLTTKRLGWQDYFNSKYSEENKSEIQYKLINPQPSDLRKNNKKEEDRYGFHD